LFDVTPFLHITSKLPNLSPISDSALERRVQADRKKLESRLSNLKSSMDARRHLTDTFWKLRSFPLLSILSPAMISHEGNIEYPGDPVCLYHGISRSIQQAHVSFSRPFSESDAYATYCPQIGRLPDIAYRLRQDSSTRRSLTGETWQLNTDQTVFDPRAWNAETRDELLGTLAVLKPAIVLISSVSCAHRYALAMAREIKSASPQTVIILGGRHADETVRYDAAQDLVHYAYSSTVRAVYEGRAEADIDFVISRDGAYALDYLLKALSLIYDPETGAIDQLSIAEALISMAGRHAQVRGQSVITWLSPEGPQAVTFSGPRYSLSDVPHAYYAFAIRARFPIFLDDTGAAMRTAHVLTADACPYQCSFCSEGIGVMGRMNKLSRTPAGTMIERLMTLADYGAQALFFDDSVMFGGNMAAIREFSVRLASIKSNLNSEDALRLPELADVTPQGLENLRNIQWGAQLTGEFLSTFRSEEQGRELLSLMADAGCTYVYFGIESLAEDVIGNIHKHRKKGAGQQWTDKIRTSLRQVKSAGIRVGSSVLFGLDGENRSTIDETIDGVAALIQDGLLDLASPNIMTYHPGTEITRLHQMGSKLDYHSTKHDVRPPYSYFEQAFPGVVSKHLTEADIWYIHERCQAMWGTVRNSSETTKYKEESYGNV